MYLLFWVVYKIKSRYNDEQKIFLGSDNTKKDNLKKGLMMMNYCT